MTDPWASHSEILIGGSGVGPWNLYFWKLLQEILIHSQDWEPLIQSNLLISLVGKLSSIVVIWLAHSHITGGTAIWCHDSLTFSIRFKQLRNSLHHACYLCNLRRPTSVLHPRQAICNECYYLVTLSGPDRKLQEDRYKSIFAHFYFQHLA